MPQTLHDFAAAVESLISIDRDAEQGFRAAADAVTDPVLKRMFVELSTERAAFATEIQDAVRRIGFEPLNPMGTAGTLRGVWIALKGAILANKAHSALEETERGEDESIKTYSGALTLILQPELRSVVERQFASIQASHARIRTLRDLNAPPTRTAKPDRPPKDVAV